MEIDWHTDQSDVFGVQCTFTHTALWSTHLIYLTSIANLESPINLTDQTTKKALASQEITRTF